MPRMTQFDLDEMKRRGIEVAEDEPSKVKRRGYWFGVLPYPPSVNRYWRHPSKGKLIGRTLISKEGRAYRKRIANMPRDGTPPMTGPVYVRITVNPPDRRKRDIQNVLKCLLDVLEHIGVYKDDSQINKLAVERGTVIKGGNVAVTVSEIETCAGPG